MMVRCSIILLSFCIHRSRLPLDAYFQVSRTQPHLPTTSHDSGASNPVSEDLEVSSNSDSDSDSSIEYEEVLVQAEEPGVVVLEGKYFIQIWIHRLTSRKLRLQKL